MNKDILTGLNHRVKLRHYAMVTENNFLKNRRIKRIAAAILILLVILLAVFIIVPKLGIIKSKSNKTSTTQSQVQTQTITIDKKFTFSGLDDTGKKKGEIELKITTAEKTDQVIVQDKTYASKNDKTFLIINLELKNDSAKKLNINTGDLTRLVVNDQNETKFAPDLHNNYVLVAALSTKIDRLGFVIDKNAQGLKLLIGELESDKEEIKLDF